MASVKNIQGQINAKETHQGEGGFGDDCLLDNMHYNTQMPTDQQTGDSYVEGSNTQPQPADQTQMQDRKQADLNDQIVNESVASEFEPMIKIIDKIHIVDKQISMRYEMLRFSTFQLFPEENKTYIIRLAQAGFYFAGNGDEVLCYCCGIRKSGWQETDVPLDIHRELNPNCTFLLENVKVNVPVKQQSTCANRTTNTVSASVAASECNASDRVRTKHTFPSDSESKSSEPVSQQSDMHNGIATTSFQNKPEMSTSSVPIIPAQSSSVSQENIPSSGLTSTANKATNTAQINNTGGSRECITANRLVEELLTLDESESESSQTSTPDIAATTASASQTYVQKSGKGTSNKHTEQNEDMTSRSGQRDDNTTPPVRIGTAAGPSGERAERGNDVVNLLLTDPAQTVFEMGYSPDSIRRAILSILENGGSRECITANRLVEELLTFDESESEASHTSTPDIAATTVSASQTYVQNSGKGKISKHTELNENKTSRSGQRDDNTTPPMRIGNAAGPSELERFLTKLWRGFGESRDILEINCKVSVAGITLELHDFETLKDGEWLNDKIIDSFLQLLHWRHNGRPTGNRIYVMATFVGNLWSHGLYNTYIYEQVQLTKYTWVFVPFNVNENHWVLLTVHMPTKVVRVYDSLHEDNRQCFDMWVKFMAERAKHVSHDCPSDWNFHNHTNLSARQIDGSSCGAFVLLNAKAITDGVATQNLNNDHALAMRHFVRCKLLKASRKSESRNTVCDAQTCKKKTVQSSPLIGCEACSRFLHSECENIKEYDNSSCFLCDNCKRNNS